MSSYFSKSSVRGFSLVELMISIAIFGLLTTVIVANYPETEMRVKLAEINQNISLAYREAQIRGSAIDSQNSAVGGYGVHVEASAMNRVILFNDFIDGAVPSPNGIPIGDGIYQNTAPTDETNTILMIPNKFSISKLCVMGNGSYSCGASSVPAISSLTVAFIRPNPMPVVYINNSRSTSYSGACVELQSIGAPKAGHIRSIQIFNSGMIKNAIGPC